MFPFYEVRYSLERGVQFDVESVFFSGFKRKDEVGEDELGGSQGEDEAGHPKEDNFFEKAEGGVFGGKAMLAMEQVEKPVEDGHLIEFILKLTVPVNEGRVRQ